MKRRKNQIGEAIYLFICAIVYFITPVVLFFIGNAIEGGFLPRDPVTQAQLAHEMSADTSYLVGVGLLFLLIVIKILIDFFRKIKTIGNRLAMIGSLLGLVALGWVYWIVYLEIHGKGVSFNLGFLGQFLGLMMFAIIPLVPTVLLIVAGVRKVRKMKIDDLRYNLASLPQWEIREKNAWVTDQLIKIPGTSLVVLHYSIVEVRMMFSIGYIAVFDLKDKTELVFTSFPAAFMAGYLRFNRSQIRIFGLTGEWDNGFYLCYIDLVKKSIVPVPQKLDNLDDFNKIDLEKFNQI